MARAKGNTTSTVRLSVSGKAVAIILDILSVCSDSRTNKTAIMYRTNLSQDELVRYLAYPADQELLEMNQRRFRLDRQGPADAGRSVIGDRTPPGPSGRAEEDMGDAAWHGMGQP